MADFTLTPGPFPVGTTVGVYRRQTVIDERGPKGSVLTSGTTLDTLTTPLTGLTYDTEYWAAAQVNAVWRKVAFRTDRSPDSDLQALYAELVARTPRSDGNLDLSGVGTRIDGLLRNYQSVNGINDPARPGGADKFLGADGDTGNGSGASFFLGDTVALNHQTKGSLHVYTAAGVLMATDVDGNPVTGYGEMGLYEGSITVERIGAYVAGSEIGVQASVPARAVGFHAVLTTSDTLAEIATALADGGNPPSRWAQTGTVGFRSYSNGPERAGVGHAAINDHEWAFAYAPHSNLTTKLLAVLPTPEQDHDIFSVNALGVIEWRDPAVDTAEPLTQVKRMAADTPGTPGNFRVDGVLSVGLGLALGQGSIADISPGYIGTPTNFSVGADLKVVGIAHLSDSFQILDAADITTSATAGAASALPATPTGYFKMYDNVGNVRKVAFYS